MNKFEVGNLIDYSVSSLKIDYGRHRIEMLKEIKVVIGHLQPVSERNSSVLWIHEIWSLERDIYV